MAEQFVRGYAVVIGAGADLPATVRDANAVGSLLCDPMHCAYQPEHVQILVDAQARRDRILAALDTLAQQVRSDPEASALIYFSGHGVGGSNPYLVPFGYQVSDLSSTAISGRWLSEWFHSLQARRLLVLLDSCHAGGQADIKAIGGQPAPVPPGLLETLQQGRGRVLIASSHSDEQSFAGKPFSIFTGALLEGLAGYGAFEHDGYARVLDIALYVGRKVPERTNDRQHPIVKVAHLEDNFALAYYAGGDHQPKQLPWSTPIVAGSAVEDVQRGAWRRQLAQRREALLLIEERMAEYVEYQDIPLQLIKNQRQTEAQIAELERKLGLREG